MICVWLAGGSLYAEEEAPDDGANIDAGQPTKAKGIISQILMFIKPAKREKDKKKKGRKTMKRLVIERMNIRNFKGVRELDISFGEKVTRISGMNGTGKTTIPDAFSWCIWNKDSRGNAPGTPDFRENRWTKTGTRFTTSKRR